MSKKGSSQHFISRNRAPRVQIVYDPETGGANRKVELPFVVGVMADLSGKNNDQLKEIPDRAFTEIDNDNFDRVLKAAKPKVTYAVENRIGGEGDRLAVDLTFESLEDFSPAQVARKVEPLKKLLEYRTQLANLLTYMDGRANAENLVANLLKDPALLQALAERNSGAEDEQEAGQ